MLQPFPDEFTGRNYTKIIVYSAVGVGGCLLITLILGFALHYLNISGTTARLLFASPIFSASCLSSIRCPSLSPAIESCLWWSILQ